jgi:small conductance mechanosensitive channel
MSSLLLIRVSLKILAVLFVAFLLSCFFSFGIKRLLAFLLTLQTGSKKMKDQRIKTIGTVMRSAGYFLIGVTTVVMVLKELSIDTSPILASAGIVGLAASLGAQALIKDIIAGLFVLVENQYGVGDEVQLDEKHGIVQKLTLRRTILRDNDGAIHHIPHGSVKIASVLNSNDQ